LPQKRSLALVSTLQGVAAAEIINTLHLRDFRSRAIFEFFNTICQQQTYRLQHNSNVVTLQAPNRLALARKKHTYFKDVNPGRSSQRCPLRARFALASL
jgi:hypothetical protein